MSDIGYTTNTPGSSPQDQPGRVSGAVRYDQIQSLSEEQKSRAVANIGGVENDDPRLDDARTPTAHKSSHATGGSDPLTPADIGAATAAQGAKADSSVQPGDLGSAAFTASTDYATAAQGTDAREWTAETVGQAEAEAGAATTRRAWTAQRVRQAIAAWWATVSGTKADASHTHAWSDLVSGVPSFGDAATATMSYGGNSYEDAGKVARFAALGDLRTSEQIMLFDSAGNSATFSNAYPTITSSRAYNVPDASGTLALTSNPYGQLQWSELGAKPSTFAPSAHKSSHATGGSDALTASDIGAAPTSHTHTASQISDSTATGRSLMNAANAAGARTTLELGNAALATTSSGGNGATDSGKVLAFGSDGSIKASKLTVQNSTGTIGVIFSPPASSFATPAFIAGSYTVAATANSGGVPDNIAPPLGITTPVDADEAIIRDSVAGYVAKRITFANFWTWIASKLGGNLTIGGTKTWSGQQEATGQAATNGTSVMTRDLVDARGGRIVSATVGADESGPTNSSTLTDSATAALTLEAGTWDIECLIAVSCVSTSAGSKQKLNWSGTSSSFSGGLYQVNN